MGMPTRAVIIGARCGSKSIPHKSLSLVHGIPLLVRAIMAGRSLQANGFADGGVIVSSDSDDYLCLAKAKGAWVQRRETETGDTDTDLGWISELAADKWEWDEAIFLRPTTTFRELGFMMKAITDFDPQFDSLRSVHEIEPIAKLCDIKDGRLMPTMVWHEGTPMDVCNGPRQLNRPAYQTNGYIDIIRRGIVKSGSVYGEIVQPFVIPKVIEVDEESDLVTLNRLQFNGDT